MSIAILALLALVAIIAISAVRTDLNTGVLAVALAYIVGVYFAGLSVSVVSTYLPEQLVLTLVGITLMFGMAQQNGTLDRLAGWRERVEPRLGAAAKREPERMVLEPTRRSLLR